MSYSASLSIMIDEASLLDGNCDLVVGAAATMIAETGLDLRMNCAAPAMLRTAPKATAMGK